MALKEGHHFLWLKCELLAHGKGECHGGIHVYDSNVALNREREVKTLLTSVIEKLPMVLERYEPLAKKYAQFGRSPFSTNRVKGLETNERVGDCGVYTLKYIELLIAGKTEQLDVSDKNVDLFRNELAHNIFNCKWNRG